MLEPLEIDSIGLQQDYKNVEITEMMSDIVAKFKKNWKKKIFLSV